MEAFNRWNFLLKFKNTQVNKLKNHMLSASNVRQNFPIMSTFGKNGYTNFFFFCHFPISTDPPTKVACEVSFMDL